MLQVMILFDNLFVVLADVGQESSVCCSASSYAGKDSMSFKV